MALNQVFNLFEEIQAHGDKNPTKVALITHQRTLTYKELCQQTNSLANWMLQNGSEKGDRALIHGTNSLEMVVFMLACAKIGVVAVPVNTRLKETEMDHIIKEIQPTFLFSDHPLPGEPLADLKGEIIVAAKHFETIVQRYSDVHSKTTLVSLNDPFLIIYTAAVDGNPKGAVITHKNVLACNEQMKELLELTDHDICGVFTPLYHIAGTSILFSGLHYGLANVVLSEFNPAAAVEAIQDDGVSIICSFSPMGQMLLEQAAKENVRIESNLRGIFGLDTKEVIQQFLNKNIQWYGIYAQTEVTGIIAAEKYSKTFTDIGLIGKPGTKSTITLRNEMNEEVKPGEVGEICVVGDTVFSHYWNRPGDTEWVFRDEVLHTGDLASRDRDGRLWFKGRKSEKELIKTGGENVYPLEVERVIKMHPKVQDVVVFGVPDQKWFEMVKAVIVLKENECLSEDEITAFCREHIAAYKIPKLVVFTKRMPMKEGSIDREEVKRIYC